MPERPPMKIVILDRDGTINEGRDDYVKTADEWRTYYAKQYFAQEA